MKLVSIDFEIVIIKREIVLENWPVISKLYQPMTMKKRIKNGCWYQFVNHMFIYIIWNFFQEQSKIGPIQSPGLNQEFEWDLFTESTNYFFSVMKSNQTQNSIPISKFIVLSIMDIRMNARAAACKPQIRRKCIHEQQQKVG